MAVIRRLIKFATQKTGVFETVSLVLTYLSRVSLNTIRDLLE